MRWDSLRTGILSGLLAPILGFFLYAVIYTTGIRPHTDLQWFIHDLFLGTRRFQSPILSLSLIANLPVFFWFDRKAMPKAMRGVILATFMYGAAIVLLSF